jgi:hypothetical protein
MCYGIRRPCCARPDLRRRAQAAADRRRHLYGLPRQDGRARTRPTRAVRASCRPAWTTSRATSHPSIPRRRRTPRRLPRGHRGSCRPHRRVARRVAQSNSQVAIVNLVVTYAAQNAYYQSKFPGQPVIRNLGWRSPTRLLPRRLRKPVAGCDHARRLRRRRHEHGAGASRRGGGRGRAGRPALTRRARPHLRLRGHVVVHAERHLRLRARRRGLVPDGKGGTLRSPSETGGVIRASTTKAYLVPIEQSAGLSLSTRPCATRRSWTRRSAGSRSSSPDAWMVDVNDRFVAKVRTSSCGPRPSIRGVHTGIVAGRSARRPRQPRRTPNGS